MSRQDKATTDRNARTLRELVKQVDNKNCADCKKNDARWASWNLGLFICIRCSGIHRSMGTHISKVKSIDLDIWQPEQMESVQRWGNRRANCYWEAHLKQGHVPPDHKMESFIRSKYESRRWAMSAPLPSDPSIFDGQEPGSATLPATTTSRTSAPAPAPSAAPGGRERLAMQTGTGGRHALLSGSGSNGARAQPTPAPVQQKKAATAFDLLGDDFGESVSAPAANTGHTAPPPPSTSAPTRTTTAAPPAPKPTPTGRSTATPTAIPSAGLFDLDFKPPPPGPSHAAGQPATSTMKSNNDIMSLFGPGPASSGPPAAAVGSGSASASTQSQPQARQGSVQGIFSGLNLGGGGGQTQAPVALAPAISPGLDFTAPRQPSYFPSNVNNNNNFSNPSQPQRDPSFSLGHQQRQPSYSAAQQNAFASPPSYHPNPQQNFASWNGGGTSSAAPGAAGGWGQSPVKLPPGMGNDVWGAPVGGGGTAQQTTQQSMTTSPTTASRRKPSVSNPYLASGADVWGSPSSSAAPASSTSYAANTNVNATPAAYASSGLGGGGMNPYSGATEAALGGFGSGSGAGSGGMAKANGNSGAATAEDPFGSDIWK